MFYKPIRASCPQRGREWGVITYGLLWASPSQQQSNQVPEDFFKTHKLSFRHRIEGSERRMQGKTCVLGSGSGLCSHGTLSDKLSDMFLCVGLEGTHLKWTM